MSADVGDPGRGHWLQAVGHARGPLPDRRAVDALAAIAA